MRGASESRETSLERVVPNGWSAGHEVPWSDAASQDDPLNPEATSDPLDRRSAMQSMAAATEAAVNAGSRSTMGIEMANLGGEQMVQHMPAECASLFASLQQCMRLRDKYIDTSLQGSLFDNPKNWDAEFCEQWSDATGQPTTNPSDTTNDGTAHVDGCAWNEQGDHPQPWKVYPAPPRPHWEHFSPAPASSFVVRPGGATLQDAVPPASQANAAAAQWLVEHSGGKPGVFRMEDIVIPGPHSVAGHATHFRMEHGVYKAWYDTEDEAHGERHEAPHYITHVPSSTEFFRDLDFLQSITADGPAKTFAWRRLKYLESKWNMYKLLNEYRELDAIKKVPHRDFYNVRKVDTHVHHSASMNQKHLLRFIKSKIKRQPNDKVIVRNGEARTLQQVFSSLGLTAYDLSIDTLDMHAHQDAFHRFDRFNLKYNPIGESQLREIFLKTDNSIHGRYLAEITKEIAEDLEASKYQMSEYRISIYGRSMDEWDKLASWVVDHRLFSHNIRWLIQVPRLYDVYKANNNVDNFEDVLRNVFQPLFEATQNPASHPKMHILLQRVVGFDLVDDESKPERRFLRQFPPPHQWNYAQSPPYAYWMYYMFGNMANLNQWRKIRGFNTLVLRPHAGEAGDPDHLAATYLTSHSISHGILLRKVPVLQYLYYLKQIALATSPLSNNALFLAYERNPFPEYFRKGLVVTLSTDDPLQFHLSKEPLLEEYSIATQIYKLTSTDIWN
ncbi:Amd1p [Malassezia vespertilionis]|uniref:AMP deaminase n=1 Tax=Malassezia vespertilionis TaxID=2020962 RepID=A0A2N1JBZ7_9BASI|nr:Amd1p [Malassezia vespertilionis]